MKKNSMLPVGSFTATEPKALTFLPNVRLVLQNIIFHLIAYKEYLLYFRMKIATCSFMIL